MTFLKKKVTAFHNQVQSQKQMQNLSNLTQLDLLDEESYLQPHIIAKAKQYDFLPIAYHSEMIQEKIRGEFADQKLQAQLEMCQKF